MKEFSYITNADPSYIDSLYNTYLIAPESLDPGWQKFFQGFLYAQQYDSATSQPIERKNTEEQMAKEMNVLLLIDAFRKRGHLLSDTNPIRLRKDRKAHLDLEDFSLTEKDLETRFYAGTNLGLPNASLKEILQRLKQVYCSKIGFEIQHIESNEKREWLQDKIEKSPVALSYGLSIDQKKRILQKLNGAVIFEKFLHTKYVGQKRFSLEGGESTIPALDFMIEIAKSTGVQEVVLGMAHRGRLNVLANIIGKTYEQIFNEFEGTAIPDLSFGSGDVKYHLGYSSQVFTNSGEKIHLKLAPNPSHLEAVDPVVVGIARAKADLLYQSNYDKILPLLIHGDAAIAGQGVVYETIQMSKLDGYYSGGTIHFIINNQIGFTTDFDDARSSAYCTAAANMIQAPVFHVNGDEPEAVVFVSKLAVEYRQHFNEDVFIDMVCYRRHGHNEGDDPKFTQPILYSIINKHPNVRELYLKTLIARGDVEAMIANDLEKEFWNLLQNHLDSVRENPLPYVYQEPEIAWKALKKINSELDFEISPNTGIESKNAQQWFLKTLEIPKHFNILPKTNKIFKAWKSNFEQNILDWSMAEILAYSSILADGNNVRLSGQDVKRGTFSHRHAVLVDESSNSEHNRLNGLTDHQGQFFIYNSLLSEFAVLGFEYGYSLASPDQLVIWEAQFGDFSNGAQVIIDQFISCAQSKWNRMSGIVLLLPHGYDGQGPEHSSARLERFLQACAEFNLVVANVSNPANFFHILRRQIKWNFRKPLIIMSPKSLLRHPKCVSPLKDFCGQTRFLELILDPPENPASPSIKMILCSGQFYYDILQEKEKHKYKNIGIVRIEQLYPFPKKQIQNLSQQYPGSKWIWCQEEPRNMGAANFIENQLKDLNIEIIARPSSASPAVGHKKIHDLQLVDLLNLIFQ
ncbi:MAG: 2-oxoglutarate dehydrogenase E1 component [Saprospiraceae bacterium]|nr:2-oxoglutarate dehydrogenase E1 component [Saprospiraceae bacterium]